MNLFDTRSAADKLGISAGRLRQLRLAGRIKGLKIGSSWAFTQKDIDAFTPRPNGRPKAARFHPRTRKTQVSDAG